MVRAAWAAGLRVPHAEPRRSSSASNMRSTPHIATSPRYGSTLRPGRFLVAPRHAIEYPHAASASSPPAASFRAMHHDTSTGGFDRRLLPLLAGVITASLAVFFSTPTLGPLDAEIGRAHV